MRTRAAQGGSSRTRPRQRFFLLRVDEIQILDPLFCLPWALSPLTGRYSFSVQGQHLHYQYPPGAPLPSRAFRWSMNDSFPYSDQRLQHLGSRGVGITSPSSMKMKCKSPPPPPYKRSPGLLTGRKGWGAVKQRRNISLCVLATL